MNSKKLSVLLAAITVLSLPLESFAADDSTTTPDATNSSSTTSTPAAASGDATTAKSSKSSGSGVNKLAVLPTALASFAFGTAVGIPVAFVRKSAKEVVTATTDLTGDTSNPLFLGAAGVLGLPAGILSGAFEGVFNGIYNSATNAVDQPFSKDSCSLGELK